MTAQELASRQRKASSLSVTVVDDGYLVPSSNGGEYIVSYSDGRLVCKCMDFAIHRTDPDWRCKHILAVMLLMEVPEMDNPPPIRPISRKSRYDAIDLN